MKLKLSMLSLFVFFYSISYFIILENQNKRIDLALKHEVKQLEVSYLVMKDYFLTDAKIVLKNISENVRAKKLFERSLNASRKEKIVLRGKLFKELSSVYKRVASRGMTQLQFVFPNNISFLRMHNPDKFGDDLTAIRYGFKYVNENRKMIEGFEQGRRTHSFRYVVPLFNEKGKYLGALECSLDGEVLEQKLRSVNKIHSHFLVRKDIFNSKKLDDEFLKHVYINSIEHSNYVVVLNNHMTPEVLSNSRKKIIAILREQIDLNVSLQKPFSLYQPLDKTVKVLTFLPIANTTNDKNAAYIITYTDSYNIKNILFISNWFKIALFFGLFFLFYFIYIILLQKKELIDNRKDLLQERKLFVTGPTVIFKWRAAEGWPVEYVSENVKEQFGYSVKDLLSSKVPYPTIVHPDDVERVGQEVAEFSVKAKDIFEQEYRLVDSDKKTRWISDVTHIIRSESGEITHYHGYIIDITRIKELWSEKEKIDKQLLSQSKLALLGEMAAGVGHEVNNPLAASVGNILLIEKLLSKEGIDNPKIVKSLENIKRANERIKKIVSGLRIYARTDTNYNEIISIRRIIIDTVDLISAVYQQDGVELINDFCDPLCEKKVMCLDSYCVSNPLFVKGNMGRLQQIIMNLISNAKDATEGQQKREVIISLRKRGEKELALSVIDNGSGIPNDIKDKILNPFFTTKEVGKGTGMGLGITNEFLKTMDGELEVKSTEGEGSCFTIVLPSVEGGFDGPIEKKVELIGKVEGVALVVDDEEDIREILVSYLEGMGLVVEQASDGDIALEMVRKKQYNYVCTDIKMPRMNGDVFIEEAKKLPNGNCKYIIITGGVATTFSAMRRESLWKLSDSYLLKPFTEEALYNALVKKVKEK